MKLGRKEIKHIRKLLPDIESIVCNHEVTPYSTIAISIFDKWLGEDNLHSLDCKDSSERQARNEKFKFMCKEIFANTDVYTTRYCEKRKKHKIIIKKQTNEDKFLKYCDIGNQNKYSNNFYVLLLPEYEAVYIESWDDTNILYFRDQNKIESIVDWATKSGLHIIKS